MRKLIEVLRYIFKLHCPACGGELEQYIAWKKVDLTMNLHQQKLVEENHNLIYAVLKKYKWPIEDYYGIAAIALCRAAKGYDSSKGVFSTYAWTAIQRLVHREWLRDTALYGKKDVPVCSLSAPVIDDLTVGDTIAAPDELDAITEDISFYGEIEDGNYTPKQLLLMRYMAQGYKEVEIAAMLGVSRNMINQRKKAVAAKLRTEEGKS